jgi:four helix bundle protein
MPESTMKVYQKWEDMATYLYTALRSYPKSERFTLAADTSKALWKIGTCISRANAVGNNNKAEKRRTVELADITLVELKVLIRMGMKLEFLSLKKYEILCGQITEVGRMIGGWMKSIQ